MSSGRQKFIFLIGFWLYSIVVELQMPTCSISESWWHCCCSQVKKKQIIEVLIREMTYIIWHADGRKVIVDHGSVNAELFILHQSTHTRI